MSREFWVILFAFVVEVGLFVAGLLQDGPVWYHISIGIFILGLGYLVVDVFTDKTRNG